MRFRAVAGASALIAAVGCGSRVSEPPTQAEVAMTERQAAAFVEALKPRRPDRPLIAVVARNEGTETTDLLLPHAVLQRAGVADVQVVAPRRGRIALYPVLEVDGAQDLASFDQAHPNGADYVIVPAMDDAEVPAITAWLKQQAGRGARIIGVCAGALIVGRAGLLDGRRFTTHWFFLEDALERHPTAVYVPHQRYVIDRDVATTTGVTASVPSMLALVEAIGGREKAQAIAAELGLDAWSSAHDSSRFGLNVVRGFHYTLDKLAFWRNERWHVEVRQGMDDIALALAADAWSRTGHIRIDAAAPGPVKLRSGIVLVAQPAAPGSSRLPLTAALAPLHQLDRTLCEIGERFGAARREWVAIELEYGAASACAAE
jgi:putative intracellular protease/amidase